MCTHLFSSSWKSKRLLLICMLKAISQQSSFKWLFFIESVRSTHFKMVNSKTANSKSNSLSCTLKDTWFLLSHSSHTFIRTHSSFWESCMNHTKPHSSTWDLLRLQASPASSSCSTPCLEGVLENLCCGLHACFTTVRAGLSKLHGHI